MEGRPDHFAGNVIEQQFGHLASCLPISHVCVVGLLNFAACNIGGGVVGFHARFDISPHELGVE